MRADARRPGGRAFEPKRKQLFCRVTRQTGGKRGIMTNGIQAGEGFDKNIPRQVLRGVYIFFRDPQAQGIDSPSMLMIESGKRLPVARFRRGLEAQAHPRPAMSCLSEIMRFAAVMAAEFVSPNFEQPDIKAPTS